MSTKRSSSYRRIVRLMVVVFIIGLMSYAFMNTFKSYVEDTKREQARYNLEHTLQCLSTGDVTLDRLNKDYKAKLGVEQLWKACTEGLRTSTTGDVYVLDMKTYGFVYDNSNDVPTQGVMFTKANVGKLFEDWPSGLKARQAMTSGTDSTASTRVEYNFDGSPEWLEWKVWNHDGVDYVIVQGTQEDEVYRGLEGIMYMYYVFMLTIIMTLLIEVTTVPLESKRDGR